MANITPIIQLTLKETEFVFDIERIIRFKHDKNSRVIFIYFNDGSDELISYLPDEAEFVANFIKSTITKMKNWNEELATIRKTMMAEEL